MTDIDAEMFALMVALKAELDALAETDRPRLVFAPA